MDRVQKFHTAVGKFTQGIALISFVCVVAMMLMNVVDVVIGYLFSTHVLGAYELTQRMLMCAVFTAFAYGQSKKSHINMTIVIVHFPRPLRFSLFTLMSVLSVLAAGAMTYAAAVQTVSMGIFTLALIYDTILSFIAIFREDYAKMIQAEWS